MLFLLVCFLTLIDHREGRGGVKRNCKKSVLRGERKEPTTGRYASNVCRSVSIRGGAFQQVFGNRSQTRDFYSVVFEPLRSVPVKKTAARARRLQHISKQLRQSDEGVKIQI